MPLPMIFLPAMPCDGRVYADQIDDLRDLVAPSVQVLDRDTFADSAVALPASTPGRFILAGTAYGGCLAMGVLARAPERVAGLWLMDCQPDAHNECRARFALLPGCGHFPTLERPAICTEMARDWLRSAVLS